MKNIKIILLFIMIIFNNSNSFSQNYESEILSSKENELINSFLSNKIDFSEKRIAFITGSSGNRIISKSEFFTSCINPWIDSEKTPNINIVILTDEEKIESGGYDILLLSWVKVFTNRQKSKVINKLKKSPVSRICNL